MTPPHQMITKCEEKKKLLSSPFFSIFGICFFSFTIVKTLWLFFQSKILVVYFFTWLSSSPLVILSPAWGFGQIETNQIEILFIRIRGKWIINYEISIILVATAFFSSSCVHCVPHSPKSIPEFGHDSDEKKKIYSLSLCLLSRNTFAFFVVDCCSMIHLRSETLINRKWIDNLNFFSAIAMNFYANF